MTTTKFRRTIRTVVTIGATAALMMGFAHPAAAQVATAPSIDTVINSLRTWLIGILAGLATLYLTIGGLRYLTAGGDPGQVERAKVALRSAVVGYALAALAPLMVGILKSIVGG